MHDIDMFKTR